MKFPFNIDLKYIRHFLVKILLLIQLFAIITVPELLLLFYLAQQFGKFVIVALMLTSSLLGLFIITNSMSTLVRRIRRRLNNGGATHQELSALMLLMISGCFLIMPGFISFAFGVLIYYTPLNLVLRNALRKKYTSLIRALHYYIKIPS